MFNPKDCAITLMAQAAGNVPGRRVGVRTCECCSATNLLVGCWTCYKRPGLSLPFEDVRTLLSSHLEPSLHVAYDCREDRVPVLALERHLGCVTILR